MAGTSRGCGRGYPIGGGVRAARVDANHAQVVSALRASGAVVQSLAGVGQGVPDLLVGIRGRLMLIEVKDGSKVPSKQRRTALQDVFFDRWQGYPIALVDGPESALRALNVLTA